MKIVADENIPHLKEFFGHHELVLKSGREIQQNDLRNADILLVRSVTPVNEDLLKNTSVKFVGSATSGREHLDTQWLDANKISWYVAEGCNSIAVAEYIVCVIAALQKENILQTQKLRAAVIGVGRVGSLVVNALEALNFEVIQCDPFRAEQDSNFVSTNFEKISDVDLITFHVPLTKKGPFSTYHLADKNFFLRQKKNCVIINTSRGSVIDSDALKEYGQTLYACLDVWENEPYIDFDVLELATIATPHIAGYSVQAKQRGIEMIYNYMLAQHIISAIELPEYPKKQHHFGDKEMLWQDIALSIFDPMQLTREFKQAMIEDESKQTFDDFRKKFNSRYEFSYYEPMLSS